MAEPFGDHSPIEPSPPPPSSVSEEIKARVKLPGQRYKVPLSELVSKIVASDSTEYERLQEAIKPDFALQGELSDALRKEDWEKALNDEANFQFSQRHRPLVEAVLNGIDTELRKEVHTETPIPHKTVAVHITDTGFAVQDQGEGMNLDTVLVKLLVPKLTGNTMEKSDVIGRFGVGFYSLLSYLRDPRDNVIVRTTNGEEGWRISIGKHFAEDQDTGDTLSVVISPLNDIDRERIGQGTEVAVHARSFDRIGAERSLSDTLQYKPDATIVVNDRVVNNVQNFATLEADLPERRDEKQRKIRILESQEEGEGARVVLAVGGVRVEEFRADGSALPQTVVLDFPPGTALPKSRDKVEVNDQTIEAVETIINTVLSNASGVERTAKLVTAIAPAISSLQARNPLAYRSKNVHVKLREGVETWEKHLPEGRYLVPDVKAMEKLDLSGAIRIAPDYLPAKLAIPGLEQDFSFASSKARLFWAPFKDPQDVFVITNGTVFLNETLRTEDPRRLGTFNALLQTSDQSVREEEMKAGGQFRVLVSQEEPRPIPGEQKPSQRRRSETAQEQELPEDIQAFLESIKPHLPPVPIVEDFLIIDNNLAEPLEFPRNIVDRLFRGRMSDASFTKKEVGYSYIPQSVAQLKDLWIRHHVTGAMQGLLEENNDYMRYGFPKTRAFWEGVLTEGFYETLPLFRNTENRGELIAALIASLPESIRGHVIERVASFEKDHYPLDHSSENVWGTSLSQLMGEVLREHPVAETEQIAVAQTALRVLVADQLQDSMKVFNDEGFLAMFIDGGEFASVADSIFRGQFSEYHDNEEGSMDNFVRANSFVSGRSGVLEDVLEPLNTIRTTEGKADYVRWFLRNKDQLERFQNQPTHETVNKELFYSIRHPDPSTPKNAIFYLSGMDSEDAWQNAIDNLQLMREFTHDTTLEPVFFKSASFSSDHKDSLVPFQFLTAGRIDRANVAVLKNRLDSESFPSQESKIDYAIKALGYSHLPPDVFSQWNDLLVRIATEPSDFSSSYRSPIGDGWRLASVPAAYRLPLDTASVLQSRLALLENLPTDYARVYLKLQTMLVDSQGDIPFANNQETHRNAEQKVADMFQKLAEMPQDEAKRILSALNGESDYGKAHLQNSLTRYDRLDRHARPWLLYLANEGHALTQRPQEAFMGEGTSQVVLTGSDLVGQYFTSQSLTNVATIGELKTLAFRDRDRTRAKEVGQRRIEHAINYQSTQGYVWLRELVQNAYNATRIQGQERTVHIENYLEGPDFVISVTDPVGMPLQRVVNSLLVPQKSEWEGQGTLGYFGHGFFTTFKEADEVRIKTSQGNGQTMYAVITPRRDYKTGKVLDLNIAIGSKEEQYQGTSVYWVKRADFQDFEAARAKAELTTYAGLMPSDELAIMWNNEQINRNPQQIAQVPSPFGDVKLYAVAGENTLTQHGLYIKDLDYEYTSALPQALRDILLKQGVSIDLPGGLQLIDSRADIARKEEIVPILSPIVSEAAIRGAVQMFVSGQIRFDALPYDFFTKAEQYAAAVDEEVGRDAQALAEGQTITNWERYFQSDEKVLQLMMSIPVLDLDERKVSVYEAIRLAKEDPSVIEKLPEGLQKIFTHETETMRESLSEDETRFSEEGYTIANDFTTETLPPEFDTYKAWQEMYRRLLAPSIQRAGMDIQTTLYSKPDGSIAHYKPGTQEIGWNLLHMGEHAGTLRKILRGEAVSGAEAMGLYQFMIYFGSHEYQHRVEGTEEFLTHNAAFFDGQKRIIEDIIRTVDPESMEQTLRGSFTGGFQPPAQFSAVVGPTVSQ